MTIYNTLFGLGFVSVFLFIVWYGKKMGIEIWKSSVVVMIVYPIVVLWMFVMCWIESGFSSWGGNNIVRVFVYVPLVAYPVAKWLKIPSKKINSMLAIAPLAQHGVSHFGCMFPGCCEGYPCEWGLYNVRKEEYLFPIQPIEAIIAWIILIYLLIRGKKKNYVPDGFEYPIMLVVFGSSRFICEFFRNNNKIFLGCSSLAFHALFMAIVGIVWIVILKKELKKSN